MNTNQKEHDIINQYVVSPARMEFDKFIVPAVTIFIGLLLSFFMLFPLWTILTMSFLRVVSLAF